MKRWFLGLIACLLLCSTAIAEDVQFGGDLLWPGFHGYSLGTAKAYVQAYEGMFEEHVMTWNEKNGNRESCSIEGINVYGQEAVVLLEFKEDILVHATATAVFVSEADALAYCGKVYDEFTVLYGDAVDSQDMLSNMGEDVFFVKDWRMRSSQLPYDYSEMWPYVTIQGDNQKNGTYSVTIYASII